jgi:type II secretory pathway component PulF
MAVYAYKGVDARGKSVKGVRDADSPKALRNVLKRDGILPTEILEQSEAVKKAARDIDFGKLFRRISPMHVAIATRQLSVLLRSGVPLVEALSALIEQLDHPELKTAFTDTRNQVNEAAPLRTHSRHIQGSFLRSTSTWWLQAKRRARSKRCLGGLRSSWTTKLDFRARSVGRLPIRLSWRWSSSSSFS